MGFLFIFIFYIQNQIKDFFKRLKKQNQEIVTLLQEQALVINHLQTAHQVPITTYRRPQNIHVAVMYVLLLPMLIFSFLKARDAGGSMVIHTFGGYYGLSISWMLYRPNLDQSSRLQGSVYHSDVFAMIGGCDLIIK